MKKLFLLSIILFQSLSFSQTESGVSNEESWFKKFFSPIPSPIKNTDRLGQVSSEEPKWALRPIVVLPALKLTESTRKDAKLDALLLTSTGGGISYQRLVYNTEDKKYECTFSWSPLTVLLSGNLSSDNPIDLSLATTVGFFNNLIMFGCGYDLGSVGERSRFFGLLSIGINLNN